MACEDARNTMKDKPQKKQESVEITARLVDDVIDLQVQAIFAGLDIDPVTEGLMTLSKKHLQEIKDGQGDE